jgi:hypothetical protein
MYRKLNSWSFVAAAVVLMPLVGCSSGVEGTETETVIDAVLETYDVKATVVAIDMTKGKVTFQTPDGKKTTCKASKDVDLTGLTVGSQVEVEVLEEAAVQLVKGGDVAAIGEAGMAAVAQSGNETDVMMVDTVVVTAVVSKLDQKSRKATLTFADGSTTAFKVQKSIDLTKFAVGDNVTVQVTEGVALSIKTP